MVVRRRATHIKATEQAAHQTHVRNHQAHAALPMETVQKKQRRSARRTVESTKATAQTARQIHAP
jgi:hypothetical protein